MKQTVIIPRELSVYIERLFFEYNSSCRLIAYLMRQDDINEEYLERYTKDNEKKFIKLEIAKKETNKKYKPKGLEKYKFEFDFNESCMIYEEIE